MLPSSISSQISETVGTVHGILPVGGGCMANASQIQTEQGEFFLKWGNGQVGESFAGEVAGLGRLHEAQSPLRIPSVVSHAPPLDGAPGWVVMEWVAKGRPNPGFWEQFGQGLAALHRTQAEAYGFDDANWIGRTPQQNDWRPSWVGFFREMRLMPQMQLAKDGGRWKRKWTPQMDRLMDALDGILPPDPLPSLLHGDLWGGNFMIGSKGEPVLIDPAVYYGHRETDLAMSELFGGFDRRFYAAYKEAWPLESGYEERKTIYNLYHLLNHLNLFGDGYAGSVEAVLDRFD